MILSGIHYSIKAIKPEAHIFEVSCRVESPDDGGQKLFMPAWIPGSYMIRDFAKNIVRFEASSNGQPLSVKKLDKNTWQCAPCEAAIDITYEVYSWDLSIRSAHLDTTHAYFNGTSVFMAVVGQVEQACTLDIVPPEGEQYQQWKVGTSLQCADGEEGAALYGFGRYQASSYDDLIDHPVEICDFTLATFEACGVPHDIIISGRHRASSDRLCADLKRICEHHLQFFEGPAPMDRYVFLVWVVGDGYGGLEHRSSTSLLCSRKDLPLSKEEEINDDYRGFLGLCSHEYFHTWNIKRIKPDAFLPYNLSKETYTEQLWAFEGITSYYDDLSLYRCGLISKESYLELLGQVFTRVLRGNGRNKQTVTESSFDAWTRFYKQDESAPNNIVSYYTKGSLIALALDLTIREKTQGDASLDNVMKLLWQRYGSVDKGVPEQGIQAIVDEVCDADMSDFFERALYSTEDLSWSEMLKTVGLSLNARPAADLKDLGGKPASIDTGGSVLGVRLAATSTGARLVQVLDNGAAQKAGLSAGDIIIAVDGIQVSAGNVEKRIAQYQAGERVEVHAFRRDELMIFQVDLLMAPKDTYYLSAQVGQASSWL